MPVTLRISTSNDRLSVLRSTDTEDVKAFVLETQQDTWENADDWFVR
ncbi:DinI-like family protein [Salmonella enterica]|nr:DinI-like family protein [Salmonella enterica]